MSGFFSVYKKFSGWRFSKGNRCADLKLRRELGIDVLGEDPGRFGVAWTARVSSRILTQLGALRTFARNTSETTAFLSLRPGCKGAVGRFRRTMQPAASWTRRGRRKRAKAAGRPAGFPRNAVSRHCDRRLLRPLVGLRMRKKVSRFGDPEGGAGRDCAGPLRKWLTAARSPVHFLSIPGAAAQYCSLGSQKKVPSLP